MSKRSKLEMDRRQLLKLFGAGSLLGHPVEIMLANLISGRVHAAAAEKGQESRNYFHLYLGDGPPRWYFDLPLHPYKPANEPGVMLPNPGLNTAFAGSLPVYSAIPVTAAGETLYMPPLWGSTIPRPDGSRVPMTALLENMLMIRGIDLRADGHGNNRRKHLLPLPGAGSLDGLVGDASRRPFPAVALDEYMMNGAYQSLQGVGQIRIDGNNKDVPPLQQLLSSFQHDPKVLEHPIYERRKLMNETIDRALDLMQAELRQTVPGSSGVARDRASARKMFKSAVEDLPAVWAALLGKYRGLIEAAKALDVPGVTDAVVNAGAINVERRRVAVVGSATGVNADNPDLRSIITPATTIDSLAESFAVAEFLLTRKFGAAMLGAAHFVRDASINAAGVVQNSLILLDEHLTGTASSIIINTFFYRSIAACLYELISVLKAQDMFDETVIHLSSEFSRSPRSDGTGSDHGFDGSVISVLSGAIKAPLALGNIRVTGNNSYPGNAAYDGTWGSGAPVDHDKTVDTLNVGHVTSTVADLLRVPRPLKNFAPVAEESSKGVSPIIERARNV